MPLTDTTVLAACSDLLFTARIRAAGEEAGVRVRFVSRAGDPLEQVREAGPALVLLDLDAPWLEAAALIRSLRADPLLAAVPVVGFASHVRAEAIAAARAAGANRVLARSAFVQQLPELLRSVAGSGA